MLFGLPLAGAFAAFLALQTFTHNREMYFVMSVVVFISALLFHVDWSFGNQYVEQAAASAKGTAYVLQALGVVAGGGLGLLLARRRRAKQAAQQPALPGAA